MRVKPIGIGIIINYKCKNKDITSKHDPAISPKKNTNLCPHKVVCLNVHSFILKNTNLERTKCL